MKDWLAANLIEFSPGEAAGKFHADFVTKNYNMIGVTKKDFEAP